MTQMHQHEQLGHLGTPGDAQLSELLPNRPPTYAPERLDHLATAILARAFTDIQQGHGSAKTGTTQNDAEAAFAWLQEPGARSWLELLDYPLEGLNQILTNAGREILARRITDAFTGIERQAAREEKQHAQQN